MATKGAKNPRDSTYDKPHTDIALIVDPLKIIVPFCCGRVFIGVNGVIMDDWRLLDEYAFRNSDEAFRTLAERHGGMVYHSALRQLRDPHKAEEITQAVFIALARKAGSISRKTVLSGWLLRATRLAVLNHLRQENRRRRHEQEAATMEINTTETAAESIWKQISPHLDDALNRLSQADREAIVIRFFENKSHKEVGALLGMSEETARRRVSRAVEKLRSGFASRGIVMSAVALAAAFGTHAAQAAPAGLALSLAALAKGAAGTSSSAAAAKGILKLMAWAKLKTAAIVGGAALLAAGTAAVVVKEVHANANYAVAGGSLEGMVALPDGAPASNVTVYLCVKRQYLDLMPDGQLTPPMFELPQLKAEFTPSAQMRTGPDGRFVFNNWTAPAWVVMSDENGFASIAVSNLNKETPITLKPMGTVSGTLFVGAKPAANEFVILLPQDADDPCPNPSTRDRGMFDQKLRLERNHLRTDAEGRFSFRVPAGDYRVSRELDMRLTWGNGFGVAPLTETLLVQAESGRTNNVKVGGEGRTVVGRIGGVGFDAADWTNEAFFLDSTVPITESVVASPDWKQYQAWYQTPDGQAAIWASRRYLVQTSPDGSFKIQDVAPGDYELHLPLTKQYILKESATRLDVADATVKFTIEPTPAGHDPDADPLDLGYLQRDWVTNWSKVWIEKDMMSLGEPYTNPRWPEPEMVTSLKEQVKSRQSAKSTVNETTIDLSRVINAKLTEPLGEDVFNKKNTLAELPEGVHVFGGVPFKVSGLVQLSAAASYQLIRQLPDDSGDIAIGRKFKRLHILNGAVEVQGMAARYSMAHYSAPRRRGPQPVDSTPIAKLVLHYADGTQAELPIVPGQQLMTFVGPTMPVGLPDLPESTELAWIGTNPYLDEYHPDWALHLYRTTFQNPTPDVEVKSIDYVSTMTPTLAPFMAGLTIE
jgi:RNA polymerase sigma factor (sigma-70 family)